MSAHSQQMTGAGMLGGGGGGGGGEWSIFSLRGSALLVGLLSTFKSRLLQGWRHPGMRHAEGILRARTIGVSHTGGIGCACNVRE